jgi:hypothetical protein
MNETMREQILDYLRDIKWRIKIMRFGKAFANLKELKDVTAVILTVEPSNLFKKCLASVKAQTLPAARIEIVRNVYPVSKAVQEGINKVQTPLFVLVDDDMILYPNCFKYLYLYITTSNKCAEVVLRLKDPILGLISGIRIYRTEAVRPLSSFPIKEKFWDRLLQKKLQQAGFKSLMLPQIVGEHHPVYLPHEAFWKFRFWTEKLRYLNRGLDSFTQTLKKLYYYWERTGDISALYGIAGLFDGLQENDIEKPLDHSTRLDHPSFKNVMRFLRK